jgi:hypothetical protein
MISNVDSGTQRFDLATFSEQASAAIDGNGAAQVAALLLESAREQQSQARLQRQAEEKALRELEAEQVNSLLREADAVRAAGQARAMGMMISGGFTIVGSVGGQVIGDASGQYFAGAMSGEAKLGEGLMNLGAAEHDFAATTARAEGTRSANAAAQEKRRIDDLSAAISESGQTAREALSTASDLVRAETDADQATLYLRG